MADELERAILLRELELMSQPRNPNAVQPERAGLLDIGGIDDRLALLNQIFNPVEAIGQSMKAGERIMSPDMAGYDRLAALGDMLSGVAGVAGPAAVASRAATPAAVAVMEGLLGGSPTQRVAADMVRGFVTDESGAMRLYHGSPHDFDRFSMSKIGTGEGAQAYGHGLYFAENEGVARGYRDKLAPMNSNVKSALRDAGGDFDAAIAEAQRRIARYEEMEPSRTLDSLLAINRTKLEELLSQKAGNAPNPGLMYEVDVNANPEDFLDYDAPLSEQSKTVQKAWADYTTQNPRWLQPETSGSQYENPTGSDFLGAYSEDVPHDPKDFLNYQRKFTEDLSQAGIPGIRYLDEGSRGAGDGTRNYVVFDENLINIVRKYGVAGAAAMLGVSALDVEQAMAQGQQRPQGLLSMGAQ